MKRIIDGVTYNTETATTVARAEVVDPEWGGNPEERKKMVMYQTRGGAFFIHVHVEWTVRNRRTGEADERERDVFEPMTREAAHAWVMDGEVELLNDVFGEPPEAVAEEAPGATLYIRVPAALKDRVEGLARDEGASLNAWAMRCMERCASLRRVGEAIGEIISTGLAWNSEPEPGAYAPTVPSSMVDHMREQAEKAAALLGWDGDELAANIIGYPDHRLWETYDENGNTFPAAPPGAKRVQLLIQREDGAAPPAIPRRGGALIQDLG